MVKYRKMNIVKICVGGFDYWQVKLHDNAIYLAQSYKEAKYFIDFYRNMWG